jgi:hypothetical protein
LLGSDGLLKNEPARQVALHHKDTDQNYGYRRRAHDQAKNVEASAVRHVIPLSDDKRVGLPAEIYV